jgi:hypothetical protein
MPGSSPQDPVEHAVPVCRKMLHPTWIVILREGGGSTNLPAKELVDGPPARTMTIE